MTILELAFACFLYDRLTKFDRDYFEFRSNTDGSPDLRKSKHRIALIKWLNKWGCRQFAIDYHDKFSMELKKWYEGHIDLLPGNQKYLWELTENEFDTLGDLYETLASLTASEKKRKKGNVIKVTVGPTGAAKILFAIRPNAVAPWDIPIRNAMKYDGSKKSFLSFLDATRDNLMELGSFCKSGGIDLTSLPVLVGRPESSVTKLIDEYNWITLTKGWKLPAAADFKTWFKLQST